jgi:hypothetical protein
MTSRSAVTPALLTLCVLAGCSRPTPPVPREDAAMEQRLAAIEARIEAIHGKLESRAGEPAEAAPAAPSTSDRERLERLEQLVAALTQHMDTIVDARIDERVGTQDDIQRIFEDAVSEELEEAEERKKAEAKRRSEEMRRKWAERRKAQEQERLEKMVKELELNTWQKDRVQAIVAESRKAREECSRKAREGGSFDRRRYREDMEAVRANLKTAVGEALSEDQLEAFEKSGYGRHAMGHPIVITSDSITADGAQTIQIDLSGQ